MEPFPLTHVLHDLNPCFFFKSLLECLPENREKILAVIRNKIIRQIRNLRINIISLRRLLRQILDIPDHLVRRKYF